MRRSDLLKASGATSIRFANWARRGQLPFLFVAGEDTAWRDYTIEEAEQLRVMVSLVDDHNMTPAAAAELAERFFTSARGVEEHNPRDLEPREDIFGVYFRWQDPIEAPNHDGEGWVVAPRSRVLKAVRYLSGGSKSYSVRSFLAVNLTEAVRQTVDTHLANRPAEEGRDDA